MLLTDINDPKYNFYLRVVFDIGFFMLVNIISLNIIFGIIIDTFAELRSKQRERGTLFEPTFYFNSQLKLTLFRLG